MQKDDLVYAGNMLDTARKAAGKVVGKTRQDYDQDENLPSWPWPTWFRPWARRHAAFRPPSSKPTPRSRGNRSFGMRHKVVHDYLHVDYDIVWAVVTTDLPPLICDLEKFVPPL